MITILLSILCNLADFVFNNSLLSSFCNKMAGTDEHSIFELLISLITSLKSS